MRSSSSRSSQRLIPEFILFGLFPVAVSRIRSVSCGGCPRYRGNAGSHQTIEQSQPVALPGLISGKIGEPGEIDFYSFQARKGQELRFEAVEVQKFDAGATSGKFAPELALYHAGGSWFDPHRPSRILFEEERSSDLMQVDCREDLQIL